MLRGDPGVGKSALLDYVSRQAAGCLIDDQQWLDRSSAQALGLAARRLAAERVGLVFTTRVPSGDITGLPEMIVGGLRAADARVLLDSVLAGLSVRFSCGGAGACRR